MPADQDAFTTAELIHGLTTAIFAEVEKLPSGEFTNRKPAISSLRRNLQRIYLKRLSALAMGETQAPQDCQTIAYSELKSLEERINKLLKDNAKLDDYSKAHLLESANRDRRQGARDARLLLGREPRRASAETLSSSPSFSRPKLNAVRDALNKIEVTRMTVCDAQGYAAPARADRDSIAGTSTRRTCCGRSRWRSW